MPTSSHYLCIDNHSMVYFACEEICPRWEDLAARLFVSRSSVGIIRADGRDSADCLRKLLDVWLKRSSPEQPLPSWRGLCDALSNLDQSLSERISSEHQCSCSLCTERLGSVGVGIVSRLYNEIYQRLQNPQKVADYMYQEDAITLDQLEKIQDSTGNIKEVLFTTLESSVSLNHYHLKVFATALLNEEDTHSVGKVLTSKYKENFPPLAKSKEIRVDEQYTIEFQKMRAALGELCNTTISLLHQKPVLVSELKSLLWRSFPELKDNLQKCTSLEEVVDDIIRPRVSLIQIDYLESIFDMFHLAKNSVDEYNQNVEDFCEKMRVEHAYGQLLMELDRHIPRMESITFVLEWENKNEYCLKDVQGLFKKVVRKYSSHVKVVVMFPGNSVVIECRIPTHLHSLISKMIQDREEILNKEKVISVSAGGCTIFKRTVTVEQRDEERDKIMGIFDIDSASVHSSDASVLHSSGIDPGDVPLSIDDDVSYSESIRIYERHLRDLRRNEAKLKQTVFMKDNMLKKMSAELELMIRKNPCVVSEGEHREPPSQKRNSENDPDRVLEGEHSKPPNKMRRSGNETSVHMDLQDGKEEIRLKYHQKRKLDPCVVSEGEHSEPPSQMRKSENGKKLEKTMMMKDSMIKQMSAELEELRKSKDTPRLSDELKRDVTKLENELKAFKSLSQKLYSKFPKGPHPELDKEFLGATESGNVSVVTELLSMGIAVNCKDEYGDTALMKASAKGHYEVVKLLLSAQANVNQSGKFPCETALMKASAGGHSNVVQLLISAGDSLDEKDDGGSTALMKASAGGHSDVVQLLISAGARLDEKGPWGYTALMKASANGHSDVVQLLISAGASLEEKDDFYGESALMKASAGEHSDVVQLLVSAGARLNEKDDSQQSAIHHASARGHVNVAKALLSTGRVDLRATDKFGQSPIMIAKVLGHHDLIELFVSTGLVSRSELDKYSLPEGWRAELYYDGKLYYYKTNDQMKIHHEKHPLFEDV